MYAYTVAWSIYTFSANIGRPRSEHAAAESIFTSTA